MTRQLLYVVSVALVLCLALPAMSFAKRSGGESGSSGSDRGMSGQVYHQERVSDRNQYRYEKQEHQGDVEVIEIQDQMQDRIRDQIRDPDSHDGVPDQDQIRDRIRDPDTHLPESEL